MNLDIKTKRKANKKCRLHFRLCVITGSQALLSCSAAVKKEEEEEERLSRNRTVIGFDLVLVTLVTFLLLFCFYFAHLLPAPHESLRQGVCSWVNAITASDS